MTPPNDKPGNGPARIDTLPLDAVDARRAYKTIDTTMRQLWSAIDDLATVMPPRPTYYRVTIFGSSRMHRGDPVYGDVRRLAMRLAEMGVDIITGGGPGLMQAANEGERLGDVADVTHPPQLPPKSVFRRGCTRHGPRELDSEHEQL